MLKRWRSQAQKRQFCWRLERHADGTVAEIESSGSKDLGCVQCHMPAVRRSLVAGGPVREVRRHLWRGGHDPAMVQSALKAELKEESTASGKRLLVLTLSNVGARHFLPTGTPDRHLTVSLRLLDASDGPLREETHKLIRTVMWRPFIVDLWDTRLPYQEPRRYSLELDSHDASRAYTLEAVVRYGLLEESRRRRIGYENREPISYEIFHSRLKLKGWLKSSYAPGSDQKSFDKRLLRDWLTETGLLQQIRDKKLSQESIQIPPEVTGELTRRYIFAFKKIAGQRH